MLVHVAAPVVEEHAGAASLLESQREVGLGIVDLDYVARIVGSEELALLRQDLGLAEAAHPALLRALDLPSDDL